MQSSITPHHFYWTYTTKAPDLVQCVYRKAGSQRIQTYLNIIFRIIIHQGKNCSGHGTSETIIVGDFNLDLVKVNDRQTLKIILLYSVQTFFTQILLYRLALLPYMVHLAIIYTVNSQLGLVKRAY